MRKVGREGGRGEGGKVKERGRKEGVSMIGSAY